MNARSSLTIGIDGEMSSTSATTDDFWDLGDVMVPKSLAGPGNPDDRVASKMLASLQAA